jgi:hypothetical protein
MARVSYGTPINELTGSIAGTTFQRNFSGTIVRSKPNKIINPSNLLGSKQLGLSSLVTAWNKLTSIQKNGWNALATAHDHTDPWGSIRTISGYQWFLSNNLNLAVVNGGRLGDAPSYLLPDPPPNYSLLFQATELLIAFTESYDPDPYTLVIYATPPVRTTSSKSRISTFILDVGSTPTGANLDIASQYEAKFGYTLAQLLSYINFSIVTRICVIDPATGFRSTYAINNAAGPLVWEFVFNGNTYPASTNGHLYMDWGDGTIEDNDFMGAILHTHSYADPGYHYIVCSVTWSGGSGGTTGNRLGSVGTVNIHLESTPT